MSYKVNNDTQISFDEDTGQVTIRQRVFGSDKFNHVFIQAEELKEFVESLA
jgi:hypothetical protein